MSRKVLHLRQHESLFRDRESYQQFVRLLAENLEEDEVRYLFAQTDSTEDLVAALMSPHLLREVTEHRILKRFAEQPDLLEELRQRLNDDELVD